MIQFLLALALLWAPAAHAQNLMCPTRPPGDSSNACASTAFVGAGLNVSIPATSNVLKGSGSAGSAVAATPGTDYITGAGLTTSQALQLPSGTTCQPYAGSGAAGTASQMVLGTGLSCTSGTLSVSGSMGVTGPGSSTSNGIATWSGTGGAVLLSPTNATVDSTGNASVANLAASGAVTGTGFVGLPVLLNTLTASSSATLSDTTSLTATYSEYDIYFENILPATTSTTCEIQVHSGGAFLATNYLTAGQYVNTGAQAVVSTSTTFIPCSAAVLVSNSGQGINGRFHLSNPSGTAVPKNIFGEDMYPATAGTLNFAQIGGYWNGGNGAVDGFQVFFSSGNIASGKIKIYGHN